MKILKIGILLFLLSLISLTFAVSMPTTELETPNNNCSPYIERIIASTGYACGGYFGDTNYKRAYSGITLKGYSCPKDFTWKFTASTNLAECTDCRSYTLTSCDYNGYCSSCINGKYKLDYCKPGYIKIGDVCIPDCHNKTFTSNTTYIIPATLTYDIIVCGAKGGFSKKDGTTPYGYNLPGSCVQGKINLTQGNALYVKVGGKGGDGNTGSAPGSGGAGGSNGGGKGTDDYAEGNNGEAGGGGGGASDVRLNGNNLSDRILVGGGGGGASSWDFRPGRGGSVNGVISSSRYTSYTTTLGNGAAGLDLGNSEPDRGAGGGGGGYYGGRHGDNFGTADGGITRATGRPSGGKGSNYWSSNFSNILQTRNDNNAKVVIDCIIN